MLVDLECVESLYKKKKPSSELHIRDKRKELRGLGLICGELGLQSYSTHGATVAAGTIHAKKVERGAARVAGSRGTPAAGLRPRPAIENGFPSHLLLD
jgi:hypothetical protein